MLADALMTQSAATVAVLAAKGRHSRFGFVILGVIVLGGLVYLVVRRSDQRRGHHERDQPAGAPLPDGPAGARAVPGDGSDHPGSRPEVAAPLTTPDAGIRHDAADFTPPSAPLGASPTRTARPPDFETGDWAVEAHGLTKRFGDNVAVNDVDLYVPRGCAFGYLGPNGAGKTTLIRTLLGLTRADGGTMSLLGIPVPAERASALARVGAIVDEPRFHGHLTGRENLRLLAAARGGAAHDRIAPSLSRVGLGARADDPVASYSMGMRQRLGVAACLLGDPELLILDEPMNGLDPAGMQEMRSMIHSLVEEGRTVMLSSHLLDEVERTCDAVAIVDRGRVIRQGSIDELVRGAGTLVVRIDCSDPTAAARLIGDASIASGTAVDGSGVTVTLPAGASRDAVAELNRRVVEAGIAVYRLVEVRTTLEDWFLSVTSRLGDAS